MPEASSLWWMETMPGQTAPASHYLRNMFLPHHVINSWGLSVYSPASAVPWKWSPSPHTFSEVTSFPRWALCTFTHQAKCPIESGAGSNTSLAISSWTEHLIILFNAPLRSVSGVDVLPSKLEKKWESNLQKVPTLWAIPKSNLLVPQKCGAEGLNIYVCLLR